jgi:hypothetical protein
MSSVARQEEDQAYESLEAPPWQRLSSGKLFTMPQHYSDPHLLEGEYAERFLALTIGGEVKELPQRLLDALERARLMFE